jgi:hypothetical protein
MDRIVLVKEKVRAGFLGEAICVHLLFSNWRTNGKTRALR